MLLFILSFGFNATINKCNSANEVIIHFFDLVLHFNLILYFFLFLELFHKNKLKKLLYQQPELNLLPNLQVKQEC